MRPIIQASLLSLSGIFLISCAAATPAPTATAIPPTAEPTPTKRPPEVFTLVPEIDSATGGVTVDAEGNIYSADFGTPDQPGNTVYKITPDGEVSVFLQSDEIDTASGNAFDSQGNYYQSSFATNSIFRFTPDGELTEFVSQGILGPVGIAIDADDTLYVANCNSDSIQKVTQDGESTRIASGSPLNCPNGIVFGPDGNLYVANFRSGNVVKVTPDGETSQFARIPGFNNGHITYYDGLFYVISRGGHRIHTIDLDGNIDLLAGTGSRGTQDGPLLAAEFSLPNGIAISPDGTELYINMTLELESQGTRPVSIRVIVLP
ncbi:MAG: hypothetical protein DWQ07_21405 [Chloroflexi bacterium]|nr:MAG: hypothetical protein DWQ07_21405 [Chloroflexota bacterium]MBL1196621.1 hypothetical protein [Chloroflexota bacterium]NOH13914.1 hypothetical protein [Chloroflexota bacterium]